MTERIRKRDLSDLPKTCQADDDGECFWMGCPQIRDGEPAKTGRHCPMDGRTADDED